MCYVTSWEDRIRVTQEVFLPRIAPKLETLVLVNFADSSAAGVSTVEFPLLQNLAIVNDEGHKLESFGIHSAPNLDYFALLASPNWVDVELEIPWSQITRAELREALVHIALQILYECEDLRTFHARTAKHWDLLNEDFWLHEPPNLSELTSFEWPSYGGPPVDNLLRQLRLPVLESPVLHYRAFDGDPWVEFFHNLPTKTLKSVAFHGFWSSFDPNFTYLVHYLVKWGIEPLAFYDCHPRFVDDTLTGLTMQDEEDGTPMFLPLLNTLVICQKGGLTIGVARSQIENKMKNMFDRRFGDDPPFSLLTPFAVVSKEKHFYEGAILTMAV